MSIIEIVLLIPVWVLLFIVWIYLAVVGLLLFPYIWYKERSIEDAWRSWLGSRKDSFEHLFEI